MSHRLINIALAIAGGIFIAAVLSCSHLLGPDDLEAEKAQASDLQAAIRTAQKRARFEKAAQQACGDNAGYIELHGGGVQCMTHRGYKTQIAQVNP
jgi:hypothetical protein